MHLNPKSRAVEDPGFFIFPHILSKTPTSDILNKIEILALLRSI